MKTTKKSMTMKIVSIMLSIIMIAGILPIAVFATEPVQEVAYISASDDGQFIDDADGNLMAYVGVALDDLTAIDLDTYGLSDYKYDKDGDGNYEITLLHLYIYVHEVICGKDWSEVTISGGAGSIYFAGGLFGFEDENLRYNYNGAYPADENGWGFTADQIVLSDGDFIEVAHFSDWSFFTDSAYGFHYFTNENDEINISYSAETGTALPLKLIRVGGGMGMGDTTTAEAGYTVYYGSSIGNATGSVTTDDNGVASITFSDPGTYYVWCDGGEGIDTGSIVSSPASATVTVTGESTGAGSGSGEGSGDSGEGSGDSDETEVPDGKTSLKVTADEGITLTADARYYCNEDCEGEKSDIATSKVTSIDTSVNWSCSVHNTTSNSPYYYIMSVNAFYAENYIITGITVNGTKYVVDMTDEDYSTTYLDEYSYIGENTNCISIAIAAEAELVDQVIHIHAEAKRVAQDVSDVLDATLAQLAATVTEPAFGTNAGEWTVLCLARGGYFSKDNVYFTDYYNRIVATVNETAASVNLNGALHKNKSTENSRLIVALSAIGKDATAVGDWNLVEAY
ncbi:MAG: hypothetical protein IKJ17_05260, partial [Clostridia bacterium]|nr:hypothetical protein [Clostridia bacterium]